MIQVARTAADPEPEARDELAQVSSIRQQEQAVREPPPLEVSTRIAVLRRGGRLAFGRAIGREHVPEGQVPAGLRGYGDLQRRVPDGIDEGAFEPAGRLRASLPRSRP